MKPSLCRSLFAVTALIALCQCDDKGAAIKIKGLRDEIDQLSHDNFEAEQQRKRLEAQIDAAKADKKKFEEERAKVEEQRQAAEKQLEELRKEFERYKTQYKLSMQKRAPGLKIDDFTTTEGKSYTKVVLKEITDTGISFMHDGGPMRLDASKLPVTLQALLGFLVDVPKDEPKPVMMSNREINKQRRSDYEKGINDAMKVVIDLKKRYVDADIKAAETRRSIDDLKREGKTHDTLDRLYEQQKLAVKQLANQILQAEVSVHEARNKKVEILPEK